MAKILTKNSFTTGLAPSGLSAGELAVNVVDRKIFVGNAVGGVVTLHDQQNVVTSVNGSTGTVFAVSNVNGETGGVTLAAGTGIGVAKIGSKNITISNNGVISVNGSSGVIAGIAVTNASQTFTGLQTMPGGISANGINNTGNLTVSGTSTLLYSTSTTVANPNANLTVQSNVGAPFGLAANIDLYSNDGVENSYYARIAAPDTLVANCTNKLPTTSGTLLNTSTSYVASINGATGAITGLTASQLLITNSNSSSTVYPLFAFGAGTTAVYADITTTPLSYVPSTGTVNGRIFNGTFGASNVAKIDAQALTVTITDGVEAISFTNGEFTKSGVGSYPFVSNSGFTFAAVNGIEFTNSYATPTWSYKFPQSNGTNGQALTTNGSGTLSWTTITGGLSWSAVTADRSLVAEEGVLANKSSGTLTLTLPTTAALGKVIRVSGMQNTWRIAQNASQKIHFGKTTTTTGVGGYLENSNARDAVELVCCVADLEWNVISSIGNITIV